MVPDLGEQSTGEDQEQTSTEVAVDDGDGDGDGDEHHDEADKGKKHKKKKKKRKWGKKKVKGAEGKSIVEDFFFSSFVLLSHSTMKSVHICHTQIAVRQLHKIEIAHWFAMTLSTDPPQMPRVDHIFIAKSLRYNSLVG